MQEFYYGLPQMLWDNLCIEAEDLLREEELGTHLVAVYPAGNRIYGLESCPPGIFCLYVDTVEALINPLSNYHKQSGFKVFSVGNNSCPVIMADLFKWTQWITSREIDWRSRAFLHAIPFGQHVIHEDPSISDIMDACHQAMKDINFMVKDTGSSTNYTIPYRHVSDYISPNCFLYDRAMLSLFHKHKFMPNINPKWDKVIGETNLGIELSKVYREKDIDYRKRILEYKSCTMVGYWDDPGCPYELRCISKESLSNISKSVIDFYRFQL